MKQPLRTVGIFGKNRDPSVSAHVLQLVRYLQQRGLKVVLEESTSSVVPAGTAPSQPLDSISREIDIAVVIGGDGTMLRVARTLGPHSVPIIGVNLGRVGFLTDIPAEKMIQEVGGILDGRGKSTQRMLLHAEIIRDGKNIHHAYALNDVVITKGELARLIEFETWLDGEFVSSARADGIIVASPTGSTAYALSAGGPILYPDLPAIALVPICPHTLSQRPLVVPATSVIEVILTGAAPGQHVHASFDGQTTHELADRDRVRVRRADMSVEFVHPAERSHFDILRTKLHWGRTL